MNSILDNLFRGDFMPHGHCYLWTPEILWLNVLSDVVISLAYFTIPLAIYYFVKQREDIKFKGVFTLFSLFILCCGTTHLISIWVIWQGYYGVHGISKGITAAVSLATVIYILKAMPLALKLPTPAQLLDAQATANKEKLERVKLENINKHSFIVRETIDASHVGMLAIDEHGIIHLANQSLCKMFDYSKDELEGKSVNLLIPDVLQGKHNSFVRRFYQDNDMNKPMALGRVVHGITKNGDNIPIEIHLIQRNVGEQDLVFATIFDVREKLAADEKQKQAHKRIERISNASNDGIWEWDTNTDQIWLSQQAKQLLGLNTEESFVNKSLWLNLIDESERTNVERVLFSKIHFRSEQQVEYKIIDSDGNEKWLSSKAGTSFDKEMQAEYVSGNINDISAKKQLELNLIQLKDQAERAYKAKSQFLSNMSHEIRTPMNGILGLVQLVLRMKLGHKQREYLSKVENASNSLLNILNDILDYSKMEADKITIAADNFDIERVLYNTIGLFSIQAEKKQIELVVDIPERIHRYYIGDAHRLGQVLHNLVGNAIKFTETGRVKILVTEEIEADEHGNDIVLSFNISDTGIGMSSEQINKLFLPFTQADPSITRSFGGTGLGLSISQKLIQLMGGQIAVLSQPNVGTTFSFTIRVKSGEQVHGSLTPPTKMKVLVVDDIEDNLIIIENILLNWKFDYKLVNSAKAAIDVINQENQPFDILLVDFQMPEMNGVELVEYLYSHPQFTDKLTNLHVIMMTTYGVEYAHQIVEGRHIEFILEKPILASKLHQLIQNINGTGTQSNPQSRQKLDLAEHEQQLLSSANILLVEDNLTNQLVAVEFLKGLNANVVIANTGLEAVELFNKREFDIILMDLQMPVMGGVEATKQIRNTNKGEHVPILAMSAATMPEDIKAAREAGVNDHLAKPIDFNKLTLCMLDWLNYTQGYRQRAEAILTPNSNSFSIEGLELDKAVDKLGNNWNILAKAIQQFVHDSQSLLGELDAAAKESDTMRCLHILHTFKGMLATIGAYELAKLIEQTESNIHTHKTLDFTDINHKLQQLMLAIEQSNLSSRMIATPSMSDEKHDPIATIHQLLTKFKDGTFVTAEEITMLTPSLVAVIDQPQLDQLTELVDRLDYFAASKLLSRYVKQPSEN
ncbi:response regulator [Catenovulum agarivorans]|uniref:response regulator n=1 Tax=Catenovulum agarivorans TaxID=1172192 RepID=UPI00035D6294|nr:response regulator [Catenovulum agarivorans]